MDSPPPASPALAGDARNPALGAALAGVSLDPARVRQVWLFPPRTQGARETGLAVLVVEDGAARRAIWTLRYEAEAGRGGRTTRVDLLEEQGSVPADRVERLIAGVLRRLEDEGAPEVRELEGNEAGWQSLLAELGAPGAGEANQ